MAEKDIKIKCVNCGYLNHVSTSFSGRRKTCEKCPEFLLNPKKKTELMGYKKIKQGILILVASFTLMILPHAFELISHLDDSHRDEEIAASDVQQYSIDYTHESCWPGDDYDKSECEFQQRLDSIISAGLQMLLLAIPLYGLAMIFSGISILAKGDLTKF